MGEVTLFVRKASGLVRSWSIFDAFIYSAFSINLITLGLFIFSYAYYFEGNLAVAVVIGGAFTIFEVIVYASLISAMPRAGGDYVWQSRILGRAIGFILAVTGWWFILWLWVPLYGQMLMYEVLTPLFAIAGAKDAALWMSGQTGLLTGSLILCALVFFYISVGMKWYARVQKVCFWGGMIGLLLVFVLLGFGTNETFIANLNSIAPAMFGTEQIDLYQATLEAGEAAGTVSAPLGSLVLGASMLLIPLITFQNLWPNWGSTLYGEVRGASDYKRNFWGMAAGVIVTAVLALIFFGLIGKTLGWDFYNKANGAFWNYTWGYTDVAPPLPFWPYPVLFAAMMTKAPFLQFLVVLLMSLWWFGWSGTIFLSSTRVIFAAAFDRMLPEWVSNIEPRTRTPINALLLMVIPGMIVATLYAFNIFDLQTLALDSTLVIAVTFFGSTIAAIILPWKMKDVFDGSPIAKFKVNSGWSWLTLLGYGAVSIFLIYKSIQYGIAGSAAIAGTVSMLIYILVWILNVANAAVLLYLLYYVWKNLAADKQLPLITFAGLVFLPFLDWLLVEWFWDPSYLYGIGWTNTSSIVFMLINYGLAAAIFYGFTAYRKRQGIDVEKVYQEIPVE
ncbi:MAG: APC family permease [Anaerolineales bacterium]|uniref:APC family permease n=1 Tax=Candidatus Desulfolinea nitratireducens TaxID=2841698 RepID=A0A8J6NIY4_9CHLR|nr:APC family permease [Candidatus Desulfolinea nitratireducens]